MKNTKKKNGAAKGKGRAALSAQQTIPYLSMHPDGVCKLPGGLYTKTVEYEDINYSCLLYTSGTDQCGWCGGVSCGGGTACCTGPVSYTHLGLLERRRTGFSCANRLYVKVPDIPVVQFSDQLTDGKPPLIRAGNRPTDSRKTDLMTDGKPSPNQTNINNLIESQTKRASEGQPPAAYGRYKNVFLSDADLLGLEKDFPGKWEYYLDRLSCHIASTGKRYKSHAATIYKWAQEDAAKGKPKKGIPDYSFKEGESL